MKLFVAASVVTLALVQGTGTTGINPVGTWSVSTVDEQGAPVDATLTVTGRPGAYRGELTTSKNEAAPLIDVMSSPAAVMFLFQFPNDRLLMARLIRAPDGNFEGIWGEVGTTYPISGIHKR